MKVPKRFLQNTPGVYKVTGIGFKPQKRSSHTEETTSVGFKFGAWENPINFVPYLRTTDQSRPHIH